MAKDQDDDGSDRPHAMDSSSSLNSEAVAHLLVAWEQFSTHVGFFVQSEDLSDRQPVIDDLKRIRNTLVVLDKTATQFVIEELLAVLLFDATDESNTSELARVLLSAVQNLDQHFHQMHDDIDADNALALVAMVNDCRAYRDEMLLSDALMLAAGVEIPEGPSVSVSEKIWSDQRNLWVAYASSAHMSLVQRLLHWWRSQRAGAVGPLIRQLDRIALLSEEHHYLSPLTPLFQAASLVAKAVKDGQIDDGPALRSLYAQLERNVHRCALVAVPDDLVPDDLLRNFLYYAAQIESDVSTAISLRRRFRLDRVRQIAQSTRCPDTPTIGVGYHLTNAIRNGVMRETEYLREWLDDADAHHASDAYLKVVRSRVRLGQLEPVLTIMGVPKPLACLKSINTALGMLKKGRLADEATRVQLSQSLSQLDTLLEQSARQSILQSRGDRSVRLSARDVYVDIATDACLREARNEIQLLANQLLPMVVENRLDRPSCRQLIIRLNKVNNALQILPLPELCPLFGSLGLVFRQLSTYHGARSLTDAVSMRDLLSRMLTSLDDYLGCVLLPQPEAGQFLISASETLETIMEILGISPDVSSGEVADELPSELAERLLDVFASIGQATADYKLQPNRSIVERLRNSLIDLHEIINADVVPQGLGLLVSSARVWFAQIVSDENPVLSHENLNCLDEIQAFFPILLDTPINDAGAVNGLDELLQQLEQEAMDAPEDIVADSEPSLDDLSLADIGSLTLNVDDDLILEAISGEESNDLDETLQLVFQHECIGHLEILDESVSLALRPHGDGKARLPNEKMLRALHTLTGSAQTINAEEVVAIVLPLQRASLSLHREGRYFDAGQTRYIGELVVALRSRLGTINTDKPIPDAIKSVEARIGEFLSQTVPGISESGQDQTVSLSMGSQIKSLEDVFSDESSEILDKLRHVIRRIPFDQSSLRDAQSLLHTLKGSARMVGRLSISECTHEIESELQALDSLSLQLEVLKTGYRSLHGYLLQSSARRMTKLSAEDETRGVSPRVAGERNGFDYGMDADNLLDLATDLTVNQVRLSDELRRLRNVCQDVDSTSFRWRKLLEQSDLSGLPATMEILADMEAVCLEMRSALRHAEREQQQASRVSANLQQTLVRSRLCRLDGLRNRLSDTISDMAKVCGVAARFELAGGDLMIDRDLYKQLAAPLEHLVRNSVVHGIEPAEQRLARGKPSTGLIRVSASVDGADLVLQIGDDGRGINRESLNSILLARGEPGINSDEQMQNVLFASGFSTIENADSIAGHGLGLSAVQTAVEQLKGRLLIQSPEDAGMQITMRIPQPMVVKQVVLVRDGGRFYGIPVVHVKSVRLAEPDLMSGSVKCLEETQRVSIRQLLGEAERRASRNGITSCVVVSVLERSLQIEIDEIIGYRELVTQPLGAQLASLKRFSDGSVLPAGQRVLILDLQALLESPPGEKLVSASSTTDLYSPVALIVDDSHTTRNRTQQILSQWGIMVRSTKDGLEALESLATDLPDIMIVDLEMPRLDGFNLLRRIGQTYAGNSPSIIVVSHHDHEQDRQTAIELGAVRFLVKPYTESQLQEAIGAAGLCLPDLTIA